MEPIVGKKIEILRKGTFMQAKYSQRAVHNPIRLIYAGGLYNGRWKTLAWVTRAIREINESGSRMRLDIYTTTALSSRQKHILDDGNSCVVHSAISKAELSEMYTHSDIAIHCESFGLKQRLATRLSFSTKITECLESGCAILAIGWSEQTGIKYLKQQDAALCINHVDEIQKVLRTIADNPAIIEKYARKAYECGKKNSIVHVTDQLMHVIESL